MNGKGKAVLARAALLLCTLIWGSSFFIMKNTLDSIGGIYLLAIRFTIAAVLLSLVFAGKFRLLNKGYVLGGSVMGLLIGAGYVVQTLGLGLTTAGKNAFLTSSYCLIVPFLYWAVAGKKPDKYNISAALVFTLGLGFVSLGPDGGGAVGAGDMLTLLSGFLYACHIVAVNRISPGRDIILLTLVQFISASVMLWLLGALTEDFPANLGGGAVVSLAYLGVMCTAVGLLLQNVGQKYTPPSTAALLLSLEAVFGAMFSVIFAHERITPRLLLGFALIFSALVISEAKPGRRLKDDK